MRKLFILFVTVVFSSILLFAQETITAVVTRTKHNPAVIDDLVTRGTFHFKQPGRMCMIFNDEKEKLLMDGTSFILINDGKSSVAKGKEANHLELLQRVLQNILAGGDGMIDNQGPDMEITRQDNIIQIIPVNTSAKATRRMMFTSFTLTVDPVNSGLISMCMNEKGGNYTQYDFSGYIFDEIIDDEIFNSGIR